MSSPLNDETDWENFASHFCRLEISSLFPESIAQFANIDTVAVHADDEIGLATSSDVAPPLHVSTTYRYPKNGASEPVLDGEEPANTVPVYSRVTSPGSNRYEQLLSSVLASKIDSTGRTGVYALTYASGVAAFNGVLNMLVPDKVIIPKGSYHGLHGALDIHKKISRGAVEKVTLQYPFDSPESWKDIQLAKGDLVLIETPINPTGEAVNLSFIVDKTKAAGAILIVDSTLAPPPIQDPFALGVDIVLHSGSKYFGGHSDILSGILAVKDQGWYRRLLADRLLLGATLGHMEAWLGIRSIRTLGLRVRQQSQNATQLVQWLLKETKAGNPSLAIIKQVTHSLAQSESPWIQTQMPGGVSPVFSIILQNQGLAQKLPNRLKLFHHATSLGGVESLVEWRRMSDGGADPRLVRISVGIENWEDLRNDIVQASKSLVADGGL